MADSTSDASGADLLMMTPYLHFTRGDTLFFKSWTPSSPGAVAGASIGLVLLALLERLLFAARGVLETHWKQRLLAMSAQRAVDVSDETESSDGKEAKRSEIEVIALEVPKGVNVKIGRRSARVVAPFILSHDVTRGALYSLQSLLGYTLMLAVMTFQAAYIIAIILGLGIGELLFGRYGSARLV
ncbi:copper transporter [Auriscalpium vulgare]|uniref:Copper transporter n=1 Tax=Auriscalpium vulgare TaxID=40419 RepID=A0ACB8RX88_9AGAM|nr:copper transporter [Auriscalpium vulgare]